MRPSVHVIIPFRGSYGELVELGQRVRRLRVGDGDAITIVDNTRSGLAAAVTTQPPVGIVGAPDVQSSYHARNRGASQADGTWLLFLDADVDPTPDLIDRYRCESAEPGTALLIGSVRDVRPVDGYETLAARYSRHRRLIDQRNTVQTARPYAKTANCAVRRVAFEQIGGFVDDIRSGGDADLCFRLREAGWKFELRRDAVVKHHSRRRMTGLLSQRARHGAGAEWLEARYPGFAGPRGSMMGLARDVMRGAVHSLMSLSHGDREEALIRFVDPLSSAAFDIGRRLPNITWRAQAAGVAHSALRRGARSVEKPLGVTR